MDYEPIMDKLIRKVVRKFYEPHHVVIADILLQNSLLYDVEICERMKMLSKEVNKLILKLKEDRIVKYETKVENREDNRQLLRTVYYINYAEVRDVIKYKIFKMTKSLEGNIRTAQTEGYVCKDCNREYSSLDAQCLMENYVFKCEDCKGDLVENKRDRSTDCMIYSNLMSELDDIVDLLKETDKFNIPSMDYFQVLEMKRDKEKGKVARKEEVHTAPVSGVEEFDLSKSYIDVEAETPKPSVFIEEFVTVNGVKKPFSEVTEEDKEVMNENEYEEYYAVYSRYYGDSDA